MAPVGQSFLRRSDLIGEHPLQQVFTAPKYPLVRPEELVCGTDQEVAVQSTYVNSMVRSGVHGIDDNPRLHPWGRVENLCTSCVYDSDCGPLLALAAYQHDLLMVYANNDKSVVQFLPPLNIDMDTADLILEQLDLALAAVQSIYENGA